MKSSNYISTIIELQNCPSQIRNICILAHVDHGKTTLSDSLISSNNIISGNQAGKIRYLDSRPDEQERQITMKSSAISLIYDTPNQKEKSFLINLIDSPGHVDFSWEVSAGLRLTDGALVLVDVVEGFCSQTQTVIKQAIQQKVKCCLVLNKIDRLIRFLKWDAVQINQRLQNLVEQGNQILHSLGVDEDQQFDPTKGNVAFASAWDRWAFTIPQFAKLYSQKTGLNSKALSKALWGDHYYDQKKKTAVAKGKKIMFIQFILDPIIKIYTAFCNYQPDKLDKLESMLSQINITLNENQKNALLTDSIKVMKQVFPLFLPLDKAILQMVVRILPSPLEAHQNRLDFLNNENQNEELTQAVKQCDSQGITTVFISKMMPYIVRNKPIELIAFARIFSGRIHQNQEILLINEDGKREQVMIQQLFLWKGSDIIPLEYVPAGNILGISGLEGHGIKTATLSTLETCPSFTPLQMPPPVMRYSIMPEKGGMYEMNQIIKGLLKLKEADSSIELIQDKSGQYILAVCGEVHLQRCIYDLQNTFAPQIEVQVSPPLVSFRETCLSKKGKSVEVITENQKGRIKIRAFKLDQQIANWLEQQSNYIRYVFLTSGQQKQLFIEKLIDKIQQVGTCNHLIPYLRDGQLLSFGPHKTSSNLLFNVSQQKLKIASLDKNEGEQQEEEKSQSTASNLLQEETLLGSIIGGFQVACEEGPLCDEQLHGVCFFLETIEIQENEFSTGVSSGTFLGQINNSVKKCCKEAVKAGKPRLVESFYLLSLQSQLESLGPIYKVLGKRLVKGQEEIFHEGLTILEIQAFLPVAESFGFAVELYKETQGSASCQLKFSHWEVIEEDPYYKPSTTEEIEEFGEDLNRQNRPRMLINQVLKRKGKIKEQIVESGTKNRTLTKMK